jgi:hypothetical protein
MGKPHASMPPSYLAPTPPPTSFYIETMAPPYLSLSLSSLCEAGKKQEVGDGVKSGDRKKLGNLSFILIYVLKYYCYKPWHSLDP